MSRCHKIIHILISYYIMSSNKIWIIPPRDTRLLWMAVGERHSQLKSLRTHDVTFTKYFAILHFPYSICTK